MKRLAITLAAQVAISAAAVAVMAPSADAVEHTDYGKWADTSAIQVYTPVSLNGKGYRLTKAIKAWNATGVVNLVQTSTPCTSDTCIVIEEKPYYPVESGDEWIGLAYVKWDTLTPGTIVGADIHLNADYRGDKRVVAHEIGHALGLGHNDYRRSIMSESARETYAVPTTKDYSLLSAKYHN